MSARAKLRACFPALPDGASNDLVEAAVDEILDDHARDLADLIRAERHNRYATGPDEEFWPADLIDPKTDDDDDGRLSPGGAWVSPAVAEKYTADVIRRLNQGPTSGQTKEEAG